MKKGTQLGKGSDWESMVKRSDGLYFSHNYFLEYWLLRLKDNAKEILENIGRDKYVLLSVIDENDPIQFAPIEILDKTTRWKYPDDIAVHKKEIDVLVSLYRDSSMFQLGFLVYFFNGHDIGDIVFGNTDETLDPMRLYKFKHSGIRHFLDL
ncbi:hypothetical protein [Floridanema aerugineum]|uniref:Uncharacterized protein n=1 Tax=Floridaenema aerugineum BLCC-F46 TaxID=3153654 RepID=A0ABV4X4Q5_9CYAN